MHINKSKIILFDGICNLCISSVNFIIERDVNNVFLFASIQSKAGRKLISQYNIDVNKHDSIILIHDNIIKYRSSAVLSILVYLKTMWRVLLVFYIIPPIIRDVFYRAIAMNRYLLFGKSKKCMLPNKDILSKFLSL